MTLQASDRSGITTSDSTGVIDLRNSFTHRLELYDGEDNLPGSAISLEVGTGSIHPGETVGSALSRAKVSLDLPTIVVIDEVIYLSRAEWFTYHIVPGQKVEVISRPLGGGSGQNNGKSIVAVVAMIALTVVAGPAGPLGAALTTSLGAFGGALASAAIIAAGSFAISHFLAPKQANKSSQAEELYTFGFGGNTARPLQAIPVQYGKWRAAPDFAAPAYSEFNGDLMTDYALLSIGCGKHRIEKIEVGDTVVWDNVNGYNASFTGMSHQVCMDGEDVTLFPVNVVTASELQGSELTQTWSVPFVINGTGTVATALKFDLVWGSGAYLTTKGKDSTPNTPVEIQLRRINDQGAPVTDWFTGFAKAYGIVRKSAYRVTETIQLEYPSGAVSSEDYTLPDGTVVRRNTPAPGQAVGGNFQPGRYEARIRRLNPPVNEVDGAQGADSVAITAARAVIRGPNSFPGVTVVALKGIANRQNSGASNGQVKVTSTRILPVFKNGVWVEEPTRSIHWAAIDVWRNAAYSAGLDLSRLDFTTFLRYGNFWDGRGDAFDYKFTDVQNIDEVMDTILRVGRAFSASVGDSITIVREEPRGLAKMLFTDHDIVGDTLEIDYTLADQTWADGLVGTYVDERTWRLAEVSSAPDGVTLRNPGRVELKGVTRVEQALDMIRFMAAESQFRRVTATWTSRMEGRLLTKGSLVKITTDHPEYWGQSFEVYSYDPNSGYMELSGNPSFDTSAGANNYIEIRTRDGSPSNPIRVRPVANKPSVVQLLNPTGVLDMIERSNYEDLPAIAFSPGQVRTFPLLITGGDPDQDGEHITLRAVVDDPAVYNIISGGVPPQLDIPDLYSTTRPIIGAISAEITQRQLTLVLSATWLPSKNAVSYVAEVSYDGERSWIPAYAGDRASFEAIVGASDAMRLRVAGVTLAGDRGGWTVVALTPPPLRVDSSMVDVILVDRDSLATDIRDTLFGDEKVKGSIAEVNKKVADAQTALDAAEARIEVVDGNAVARSVDEATARANGDEANATQIRGITAKVNDPATGLAKTRADVLEYAETSASATDAVAKRVDAVTATVNDPKTGLSAAHATIATVNEASASRDAANAESTRVISAQVNDPETGLPRAHSTIAIVNQASADRDQAINELIAFLNSSYTNPETGFVYQAGYKSQITTLANADQALSQRIDTIAAESGAGLAGGKVQFTAVSSPAGVSARYSIELVTQSDGRTSGAGFYMDVLPNGQGRIAIDATKFLVGDVSTGKYPMRIENGTVYLQNVVVNGEVLDTFAATNRYAPSLENYDIPGNTANDTWVDVPNFPIGIFPDRLWAANFAATVNLSVTVGVGNNAIATGTLETALFLNDVYHSAVGRIQQTVQNGQVLTAVSGLIYGPGQLELFGQGTNNNIRLKYRINRGISSSFSAKLTYAQLKVVVNKR